MPISRTRAAMLSALLLGAATFPATAGHLFTQLPDPFPSQPLAVGQGVQVTVISIDSSLDQTEGNDFLSWQFFGAGSAGDCPAGNLGNWNSGDVVQVCINSDCKTVAFDSFPDSGTDLEDASSFKDFLVVGDPQAASWLTGMVVGSTIGMFVVAGDGVCWAGFSMDEGIQASSIRIIGAENVNDPQPFTPSGVPMLGPIGLAVFALLLGLSLLGAVLFRRRSAAAEAL